MKTLAFYKILPLFYKKLSIVIYKKLNSLKWRFIKNSIFGKNIHPWLQVLIKKLILTCKQRGGWNWIVCWVEDWEAPPWQEASLRKSCSQSLDRGWAPPRSSWPCLREPMRLSSPPQQSEHRPQWEGAVGGRAEELGLRGLKILYLQLSQLLPTWKVEWSNHKFLLHWMASCRMVIPTARLEVGKFEGVGEFIC